MHKCWDGFVENKLHWRLDVSFHEDQNKTTDNNAIENLSILNRICLNVHTQDTATKGEYHAEASSRWLERSEAWTTIRYSIAIPEGFVPDLSC